MSARFEEKFIAFIDILGFKNLVAKAESAGEHGLSELLGILRMLSAADEDAQVNRSNPTVCPSSSFVHDDLQFCSTQISDSVIVSAEISPAGIVRLISHCWQVGVRLLQSGILYRGYITRGTIFHTRQQFIGSGYQRAYHREPTVEAFHRDSNDKGTPFVEIDPAVTAYVKNCGDACVSSIYRRCTENDGEVDALFPFRALEQSFVIGGPYAALVDYGSVREGNRNLRTDIETIKSVLRREVAAHSARAIQKVEHYIAALDRQLRGCDVVDNVLGRIGNRGSS